MDATNAYLADLSGDNLRRTNKWACLQNNSSAEIQLFTDHHSQTVTVLDHPQHAMNTIEDGNFSENLSTIYEQLELNKTTLPIITNTELQGVHWRGYNVNKSNDSFLSHTSDSMSYNKGDLKSITMSKNLMDVIIHGYGIHISAPLRYGVCENIMDIDRILCTLSPHSTKFADAIVSEMVQCINAQSTASWRRIAQEMMHQRRSIRNIHSQLTQNILEQLQLNDDEKMLISNTGNDARTLTLRTTRGYQAFQNISVDNKIFLTKMVIYRQRVILNDIDLNSIESAAQELFDNEVNSVIKTLIENASEFVHGISYQTLFIDHQETEKTISSLIETVKKIRVHIKDKAFSLGWDSLTFFPPSNQ